MYYDVFFIFLFLNRFSTRNTCFNRQLHGWFLVTNVVQLVRYCLEVISSIFCLNSGEPRKKNVRENGNINAITVYAVEIDFGSFLLFCVKYSWRLEMFTQYVYLYLQLYVVFFYYFELFVIAIICTFVMSNFFFWFRVNNIFLIGWTFPIRGSSKVVLSGLVKGEKSKTFLLLLFW